MTTGACFQCHHHGVIFPDGLCLRCHWMALRDRATATDAPEDWDALDWLNREIEETV